MVNLFICTAVRAPAEHLQECIDSVRRQTYQNWTMCVVVDAWNGDRTYEPDDERITILTRHTRHFALANQLHAIHHYCPHDAVVVILDGDDRLSDSGALQAIADAYQETPHLDILWTTHERSDGMASNCRELEGEALEGPWVTSHCKTFRKSLLWGVRPEVFRDKNRLFWRTACDQALYLPLLQIARVSKFLPRICYWYRANEPGNEIGTQEQAEVLIRGRLKLHRPGERKDITFFIAGPGHDPDPRFWQDEKRPSLGVLTMIQHLRSRGHRVWLIDRSVDPHLFPVLLRDAVCLHVSSPNRHDGAHVLNRIAAQADFRGPVYVGGPHAILYPSSFKAMGVDGVCTVEADFAISRLIEAGRIDGEPRRLDDLDTIPFPAAEIGQPSYKQTWPFGPETGVFSLNTSRACPGECSFCETWMLWGREWVGQSAERVLLDVQHLVKRFGAKAVYFREDNFTCNRRRVARIARRMPIPWACEARADAVADRVLASEMASGGCRGWYMGAESGSPAILSAMHKGITLAQIEAAMTNAQSLGIKVAMSLVDGYPGETAADEALTASMLARTKPHVVWRNPYRKPGVYE